MTELQDCNFDGRAERFQNRIYGGVKGEIRLTILWEDMLLNIPPLNEDTPLSVWDAGGGLGQMSCKAAALGHRVLLSDISGEMLVLAEEQIDSDESLRERITVQQAAIQTIAEDADQQFDLIICHAVLEWLADPDTTLELMLKRLKPGGYLSLAFYNVNALAMMNVVKGNINKVLSGMSVRDPGSLTPIAPQQPEQVIARLQACGLEVKSRCGVRVAYDYIRRELLDRYSLESLLDIERHLCRQEAFWSLGRYVHLAARKPVGLS